MNFGKSDYEYVERKLLQDYNSYFSDCYEHPEYLRRILMDLYGKCSKQIVAAINKKLSEYSYHKEINVFLEAIKN